MTEGGKYIGKEEGAKDGKNNQHGKGQKREVQTVKWMVRKTENGRAGQ